MQPGKPETLKRNNRKAIIDLLRHSDELSIAEISAAAGLSKTTVMKIIDFCVGKQIIQSAGKGSSTGEGGKKPGLFRFNPRYGYAMALHISPDSVSGAITDLSMEVLVSAEVKNRENEGLETVLNEIADLAGRLIRELGIRPSQIVGTAIGAHGITNFHEGVVRTAPHFPSWGENVPLRDLVDQALGLDAPTYVDNQIRFQALAESNLGAAQGKKNVIVLEGGEGLVAGIIVKGEIKRGVHYLAGEVGHMIIKPDAEILCSCGGRGCFESMVSTRLIRARARRARAKYPKSPVFRSQDDENPDVLDIFNAANEGDELSVELMDEIIKWFTIGISNIILMYDPEIVIIQGLYANAGDYFIDKLRTGVNSCSLIRIRKNVEIHYSTLGPDRGVLGGATFVVSQYFQHNELH